MKTHHSKIKIFFIAITSIFVLLIASIQVSVKTLNHFKKGFYFEKYGKVEEAKEVLLNMHPIGSDVNALVATLKKAGASVEEMKEKDFRKEWRVVGFKGALHYSYMQSGFFTPNRWGGAITYDVSDKIIRYGLGREYLGL